MSKSFYGTNTQDGLIGNAFDLTAAGGGSSVTPTTGTQVFNFNFFYMQLLSHGGSTSALGALGSPNGRGWLLDNPSLEGVTVPTGTYQALLKLYSSDVNIGGDLYVRFYKLNTGSAVYTAITTLVLASQTITPAGVSLSLSASGVSSVTFATGEVLYVDIWWNQTSGGTGSTLLSVNVATNINAGVPGASGGMEFVLPIVPAQVSVAATSKITLHSQASTSAAGAGTSKISLKGSVSAQALYPAPTIPPPAMPLISLNAPAYSSVTSYPPNNANDGHYGTNWASATVPSTGTPVDLIYDLSHISSTQRQIVVVNLLNEIGNWRPLLDGQTSARLMVDYTLDANIAAGGPNSQPAFPYSGYPTSGWTNLATVTGNDYPTRQHIVNLNGANWLRLRCTRATSTNGQTDLSVQMDVHDAHLGTQDRWLFIGDSITEEGMIHGALGGGDWGPNAAGALSQIANTDTYGTYYPATCDAGNFGWTTANVVADLTDYLNGFTGGFVSVALGTNDVNQSFAFSAGDSNILAIYANFKTIINAALALHNIVVIPKVPFGNGGNGHIGANANLLNQYLAAHLPIDYPSQFNTSLFIGPDFWTLFSTNPQLLRSDGIHPTYAEVSGAASGYEQMHLLWAAWMTKYIYLITARPGVVIPSDAAYVTLIISDTNASD